MLLALLYGVLEELEQLFLRIESQVPTPVRVPRGGSFVFRYTEQSPEQAIILKMARSISSLRAACILMEHGHVQEVSALQRAIDDFQEEIMFMGLALTGDGLQPVHNKFLDATFTDPFLQPDDIKKGLEVKVPYISRQEIRDEITRAATVNAEKVGYERPVNNDAVRVLSRVKSGFVHGGAASVLEMYGGAVPHFHLRGMKGTPFEEAHTRDLWHSVYRVAQGFRIAALAFRDFELAEAANDLLTRMDGASEERDG